MSEASETLDHRVSEARRDWCKMATDNPVEMREIVRGGTLSGPDLTFAAEALGYAALSKQDIVDTLLPLLKHQNTIVVEGALYGIMNCADGELPDYAVEAIIDLSVDSPSKAVREIANDYRASMMEWLDGDG